MEEPKGENFNEKTLKTKRPPQMVTVNGDFITHAHPFEDRVTKGKYWFTCKVNDKPLRCKLMDEKDAWAYTNRECSAIDLVRIYYPQIVAKRLTKAEVNNLPFKFEESGIEVTGFSVGKEKNEERGNVGRYKIWATVNGEKKSVVASQEALDQFFSRTATVRDLFIKEFGSRYHLKEYFSQFQLPEKVKDAEVKITWNPQDKQHMISFNHAGVYTRDAKAISYDDFLSYKELGAATKEQLAAKYFADELKHVNGYKNEQSQQNEQNVSKSMKR